MATTKRTGKRGKANKLTREVLSIRIHPRVRYLAELAARSKRRTVSSFLEEAAEHEFGRVMIGESPQSPVDLDTAAGLLWDVDEAVRFAKLAIWFPHLLTFDEEVLWKRIQEFDAFWSPGFHAREAVRKGEGEQLEHHLRFEKLRAHWDTLQQVVVGEVDASILS